MDIYDARTVADFQKHTFSGHLRAYTCKVLEENIRLGHGDYTAYWSLELLCSGLVHSIWNTIFHAAAVHVNRAAPNVFLYLVQKYEEFVPHESRYSTMNMTDIRNNHVVRHLICEVSATVALCRKSKLPTLPKIKVDHDFLPEVLSENVKAPSAMYARAVLKQEDPANLYVATNELAFSLRPETRDSMRALYWIAWILKFESRYKKENKTPLSFAFRHNDYVDDKHLRLGIWLIWEVVWNAARTCPQQGTIHPYVDAMYKMHCIRWTPGDLKKRLPFLINAVLCITESTSLEIHYAVPHDPLTVSQIIGNIPEWIAAIVHTQKTFQ